MVNKYIRIYHKRNIQLAIFCATLVFVPLFVVALFYDIVPEDTLISFLPLYVSYNVTMKISIFRQKYRCKRARISVG